MFHRDSGVISSPCSNLSPTLYRDKLLDLSKLLHLRKIIGSVPENNGLILSGILCGSPGRSCTATRRSVGGRLGGLRWPRQSLYVLVFLISLPTDALFYSLTCA